MFRTSRISPIVPFALAALIFGLSLYLYWERVLWFGFWDGTASELERAEKVLVIVFNWLSLAMGAWLVFLGIRAFRADTRKRLAWSVALYLGVMAVAFAIDLYFRSHLMDSAGG